MADFCADLLSQLNKDEVKLLNPLGKLTLYGMSHPVRIPPFYSTLQSSRSHTILIPPPNSSHIDSHFFSFN